MTEEEGLEWMRSLPKPPRGRAQLMPAEKALRDAELAADRYDRLGAPMTFYQPHVAEMRARAGLPLDPMLRATRETQGQETDLG